MGNGLHLHVFTTVTARYGLSVLTIVSRFYHRLEIKYKYRLIAWSIQTTEKYRLFSISMLC